MTPLDDLFRDGLAGRKAEVPDGLWERIAAQQPGQIPEGERLDQVFRQGLANRRAAVPAGLWARIQDARTQPPHSGRQMALTALAFLLFGLLIYGVQTQLTQDTVPVDSTTPPVVVAENSLSTQSDPAGDQSGLTTAPAFEERANPGAPVTASARRTVAGSDAAPVRTEKPSAGASTQVSDRSVTPRSTTSNRLPGEIVEGANALQNVVPDVSAQTPEIKPADMATATPAPSLLTAPLKLSLLPPTLAPPATGLSLHRHTRVRSQESFEPIGSNRLQLEGLFGIGYTNQTLGAEGPENQLLQEEREVTEFPEAALQLTARLRYRLSPRLRLLTGLSYGELRNRFEYDQLIDGTPTFSSRTNRIRMVEVPAMLSYELPGRRLRLALNAGVTLNALTSVTGLYQDPTSLDPQSLDDSGFYRRSVGLGYTASLTTAYSIAGGRLQLLLEPYFKTYPRSFTTGAAPVSEHYWTAGLQLGVRKPLR